MMIWSDFWPLVREGLIFVFAAVTVFMILLGVVCAVVFIGGRIYDRWCDPWRKEQGP